MSILPTALFGIVSNTCTTFGAFTEPSSFFHKGNNFQRIDSRPWLCFHRRVHRFAPVIVRNADDGAFGNRWMLRQYGLDIARIDVEATGDDDFAQTVAQEQVSTLVEHAEIAGVQPAVDDRLGCLVRHVEIAGHHEIAAHDDLALFARRQQVAVRRP